MCKHRQTQITVGVVLGGGVVTGTNRGVDFVVFEVLIVVESTIHGELARLAAPGWKFLCVSGEKSLQTIWDDITSDFEDMHYLNLTQETVWNAARDREMARPLTPVERRKIEEGTPREAVLQESFWRMRPDGIAVLPPTGNKEGEPSVSWSIRGCQITANIILPGPRKQPRTNTLPFVAPSAR